MSEPLWGKLHDLPDDLFEMLKEACLLWAIGEDWTVNMEVTREVRTDDGQTWGGGAWPDSTYLRLDVDITRDVVEREKTDEVWRTIAHEVGHGALGEMSIAFERACKLLEGKTDSETADAFRKTFNDAEERFLQRMVRAWSRLRADGLLLPLPEPPPEPEPDKPPPLPEQAERLPYIDEFEDENGEIDREAYNKWRAEAERGQWARKAPS